MNSPADTQAIEQSQDSQAMLERIRALQPLLRSNADQAREERMLPIANVEALQQAGFFLALQPARWGGYEMDPQDFFRLQLSIAEACMSLPGPGVSSRYTLSRSP